MALCANMAEMGLCHINEAPLRTTEVAPIMCYVLIGKILAENVVKM